MLNLATVPSVPWFELSSAGDPKLSELAARYELHPLHLEDARFLDERIRSSEMATVMS